MEVRFYLPTNALSSESNRETEQEHDIPPKSRHHDTGKPLLSQTRKKMVLCGYRRILDVELSVHHEITHSSLHALGPQSAKVFQSLCLFTWYLGKPIYSKVQVYLPTFYIYLYSNSIKLHVCSKACSACWALECCLPLQSVWSIKPVGQSWTESCQFINW